MRTSEGFGGETGRVAHLTFKLKAVRFVDPKTSIGELGKLEILTSNGTCLTCEAHFMREIGVDLERIINMDV